MVIFCGAGLISAPQFLLPFCFCPTVHKDVTERLREIDIDLYEQVKRVLDINLQERHLRGGSATKRKYEQLHRGKID